MADKGFRAKLQRFGSYLSGMIMPNIGAFIAWGVIAALFMKDGWFPNETIGSLVQPMLNYLLPLLIGFTGGKMVYGARGGVVGATATMGVIVGADMPMFLGAMIMGPLAGYLMKKVDQLFQHKVRAGFEMLYNNFSAGFLGAILAIVAIFGIGPAVEGFSNILASGVEVIVNAGLLPLANIIIEPAKILFLNNAINHGILGPIGFDQQASAGKSILFLLEANPGPGLGVLLAFTFFGKGASKASAPGTAIIQFFGGVHEIYFPYVLMKPALLLAVIGGGVSGVFMFQMLGAGLVGTASPGSIIAILALTPQGNYLAVISGVVVATAVSFLIASLILRTSKATEEDLAEATGKMEAMKGKKGSADDLLTEEQAVPAETKKSPKAIEKIIFACDAGMGSSAMGSSLLKNRFKKANIDIFVTNKPINEIPDDADIVITHKDLTDRAKAKIPTAEHISVENFLNSPAYEQLVERLQDAEAEEPETDTSDSEPAEEQEAPEDINKIIFACDAGMGSSAMGSSLLKRKFNQIGIDVFVTNKAINDIPDDADIVITHKDLTDRAKAKLPTAEHVSVENFLNSPVYDELVERLKK